jgi:DUF4097 and DUF4098 domain-containing protein YvlB
MDDQDAVHVSTRSGKVRVIASPGAELAVDGGVMERGDDGVLRVRRSKGSATIELRCPPATDLIIGTASGTVDVEGDLGSVSVATMSGKINVERATRVDARTKSGSVHVGHCDDECRVVVVSGKVRIGAAKRVEIAAVSGTVTADQVGEARVKTISGKIKIGTAGAGTIAVKTVSGTVEVSVPPDVAPATRLHSVSGRVNSECPRGADGEIAVASVSGAIRVSCR